MRSIHKRQHCTATTVLHQRDKSKRSSTGRQQSRSARSPQDAKKAVQQREPDLHHHRTRETTTRTQNRLGTKTFSPKKKRGHSGEHHVHDTTTARLTTNGAQCQNRTKHPTIQPSEKPLKTHGQTSKNTPQFNMAASHHKTETRKPRPKLA